MKLILPEFKSKTDKYAYLVANKKKLIAQKKSVIKLADNCGHNSVIQSKDGSIFKENEPFIPESGIFGVQVIINTTNLFDSHGDVHLPGLWKKSLFENKFIMHIQEHRSQSFSHIISEGSDLNAFTKNFTWTELGAPQFTGKTEALTFDSTIRKKRNEFMFDQYSNGWVNQHSVGMFYIQLVLGINDNNFGAEFEAWEKYSSEIVNLEDAEEEGFAWFVKEAKAIEGSAVPRGSNFVTPTTDNNLEKIEPPLDGTQKIIEPSLDDTQKRNYYNSLLNN